jgi:predicted dehydrogenase
VALIGLGAVSRDIHLPALVGHQSAELIAAADPDPAGRDYAAHKAPAVRLYQNAESLLAAERPALVIVATPPHTHRDLCLLALRYGAHVLCEKPFVNNLAEADEVIAAAQAAGKQVAVNHQYRYLPIYAETARRMRRGDFGRLYFAQAQQQMFVTPEQETGWRSELRRRVLFEFGMHVLDLLSFFLGDDPLAVAAQMPRVIKSDSTDLLVVLQLTYPHERIASIVLNRLSRATRRYLDLRLECEGASVDIAFGGVADARLGWASERRRPTFRLSMARGGEAWVETNEGSARVVRGAQEGRPAATAALLSELLEDIAGQQEFPVSGRYARRLLWTVLSAYESADRGGELVRLTDRPSSSAAGGIEGRSVAVH